MAQKTKTKSTHAKGTYGLKSWEEQTWDGKNYKEAHGAKLTHAKIVYTFEGDFVGEGKSQLLMTYRDDANATYVGLQVMEGRLGDRAGNFIAQVVGTFENGEAKSTWTIIPGSGTGDLEGIEGEGSTVAVHGDVQPFTLDYSFE